MLKCNKIGAADVIPRKTPKTSRKNVFRSKQRINKVPPNIFTDFQVIRKVPLKFRKPQDSMKGK